MNPQDFVAKWSQATLKERSAYQEHFMDLCRLVGHRQLDDAYGWPGDLSDEQILERLLGLNLGR